jgi:hypothetical protein
MKIRCQGFQLLSMDSSYRDLFFWDLLGFFNKSHIISEDESVMRVRASAEDKGKDEGALKY